jgi:hypothetical protein
VAAAKRWIDDSIDLEQIISDLVDRKEACTSPAELQLINRDACITATKMPLGLSRIWIKTGALLRAVLFLRQNTRNAKSSRSVKGDLTANKAAVDDHGYGLGYQSSIWTRLSESYAAQSGVASCSDKCPLLTQSGDAKGPAWCVT